MRPTFITKQQMKDKALIEALLRCGNAVQVVDTPPSRFDR